MKKTFYMRILWSLLTLILFASVDQPILAQESPKKSSAISEKGGGRETEKETPSEKLSITRHSIEINGQVLKYTATAGYMPLKDEAGKLKCKIFFVAYTKDEQKDKSQRSITFAFNGGPGSSSIWLHLGALGPRRVLLTEEGKALPPPYKLVPNEYTWLDFTDLVFIDPVGTGYSQSAPGVDPKEFYGVKEDIESVGEFIRLYITRYKRWLSPKFIAGESYGTTRTAGLSGYLQNKVGMNLNGLFLISSVLNFQTISFTPGNDLPFILYLPSYTCASWYHRKLPPELQADFPKTRMEVEQFALNEYLLALAKGNELPETERDKIIEKLAAYTGLSKLYIKNANLRISQDDFVNELLRRENRRLGVLDSRITGSYKVEDFMEDPSVVEVSGPMVATWNDYVRKDLKYETDLSYKVLSMKANQLWNWR